MAILKDNEYTEFEGRDYTNPQVSLDESNAFIDNLRSTQQANTQQIKTDTYNLGTAVPSNLGGLTGGEGYFTSRYQTPQTNSLVNDLRATAQASALNQILQNEQAKWKNRYNKARNANTIRNSNLPSLDAPDTTTEGGLEYEDPSYTIEGDVPGVPGGYIVGNIDTDNQTVTGYTGVPYGEDYKTNYNVEFGSSSNGNTGLGEANNKIAETWKNLADTLPIVNLYRIFNNNGQ